MFLFVMKTGLPQTFNDSLYQHLFNFHSIKGELTKSDICSIGLGLEKIFHILELVPNTNTSQFKIYTFENLKTETGHKDFLVINNDNYELYDVLSFSMLINKILDMNVDFTVKTLWIREILKILDLYKSVNLENAVVEKRVKNYVYFFPLSKYRNNSEME